MKNHPELAKNFRWGGYFSGDYGKYGAQDTMHIDLGPTSMMGAGSWEKGLSEYWRRRWGITEPSQFDLKKPAEVITATPEELRDIEDRASKRFKEAEERARTGISDPDVNADIDPEGGSVAAGKRGSIYLGGVAAGKGRGAGGTGITPYLGGRAAGKGKIRPWGSQGLTAAEENEAAGRPFWALDRDEVDRAMGNEARVKGNIKLKVNVTADKGTTVKTSGDGAIKKTETTRRTPLPRARPAAAAPSAASDATGGGQIESPA
jgi:hypothetical protein